jgi:hypothetical protein
MVLSDYMAALHGWFRQQAWLLHFYGSFLGNGCSSRVVLSGMVAALVF